MIDRYSREQMTKVWSQEQKYANWLKVELAVAQIQCQMGKIPPASYQNIKDKAKFNMVRIDEIELEVKHDVIAFLTNVGEYVGEDSRYIHMGLTSSDMIDTALALTLVESVNILETGLDNFYNVTAKLAKAHKHTIQIGRSHGIHAEPLTFGYKLLLWLDECQRHKKRLAQLKEIVSYGKISGPVGTYASTGTELEIEVLKLLNLKPIAVSSQIISRDVHAQYIQTLAIIASSLEKFAIEIRHLQRSDVLEVEEPFSAGQKGSSAMPHKRNPITSENISGLARVIRSNSIASLENIALWHERDISHSSVERIILPDSSILLDYMLHRFANVIDNLQVYPENMRRNMDIYGGVIFSQPILLKLIEKGLSREAAYKIVQSHAHNAWNKDNGNFKMTLVNDPEVLNYLNKEEIENCFNPNNFLKYIDIVFRRFEL